MQQSAKWGRCSLNSFVIFLWTIPSLIYISKNTNESPILQWYFPKHPQFFVKAATIKRKNSNQYNIILKRTTNLTKVTVWATNYVSILFCYFYLSCFFHFCLSIVNVLMSNNHFIDMQRLNASEAKEKPHFIQKATI